MKRYFPIIFLLSISLYCNAGKHKPIASAFVERQSGVGLKFIGSALLVTLDGSKSYDPDGVIVKWRWYQIGTKPTPIIFQPEDLAKTTAAPAIWILGVYSIVLEVTDDDGAKGRDTVTITVNNNKPPVISLGQNKFITIAAGGCADFDITASVADPEGGPITSIEWLMPGASFVGNGPWGIRVNNLKKGIYIAIATVKDKDGGISKGQVTVTVTERSCQWWEKYFTSRCKCK